MTTVQYIRSVGNLGTAHLQDQQRYEASHLDACMPAKRVQANDLLQLDS